MQESEKSFTSRHSQHLTFIAYNFQNLSDSDSAKLINIKYYFAILFSSFFIFHFRFSSFYSMRILALSVLLLCHQQLIPEVGAEPEPVVPSSNTEFYSIIVEQHREIVEVCSNTALGYCGVLKYSSWLLWCVEIQLLVTVVC